MIDDNQESDYVSESIEADAQLLWSLLHNGREFSGDAETLQYYMRVVARFDSQRMAVHELLIDSASPREQRSTDINAPDAGDEARVDVLAEYIYGRSMIAEPGPRHVARQLLMRIDAAAPQLETVDQTLPVIDGPDAAALPDDSRIVSTGYYDELPEPGARVVQIGSGYTLPPLSPPRRWIVLHRGVPLDGGYGPTIDLEQAERDGTWPYDQKGIAP